MSGRTTRVIINKVRAYDDSESAKLSTHMPAAVQLNCPPSVLKAFQKLMEGTQILGSKFKNPYTGKTETFPSDATQLTARHLQILARNESVNTSGDMNVDLYNELSADKIARLRCLVKNTTVAGVSYAVRTGGYPNGVVAINTLQTPAKIIIVDQAGLQWQADFRNTGGMFFYPENMGHKRLPKDYIAWQNDMHQAMYGKPRPERGRDNLLTVEWNGVRGVVDLAQVANAIEIEFRQAFDAAASQSEQLSQTEEINFRFLKAGMGFFASGIASNPEAKELLECARLNGIKHALKNIAALPEGPERNAAIGKIRRIELPFSADPPSAKKSTLISEIASIVDSINPPKIIWGGAQRVDALAPVTGYVTATTNCGDPHAMPGNEGQYGSVDAAIACNAYVNHLNAAANSSIQLRVTPAFEYDNSRSKEVTPINIQLELLRLETKLANLDPHVDIKNIENLSNADSKIYSELIEAAYVALNEIDKNNPSPNDIKKLADLWVQLTEIRQRASSVAKKEITLPSELQRLVEHVSGPTPAKPAEAKMTPPPIPKGAVVPEASYDNPLLMCQHPKNGADDQYKQFADKLHALINLIGNNPYFAQLSPQDKKNYDMLAQYDDQLNEKIVNKEYHLIDPRGLEEVWEIAAELQLSVSTPYLNRMPIPEEFEHIKQGVINQANPIVQPIIRHNPFPHNAQDAGAAKAIQLIDLKDALHNATICLGLSKDPMVQFRFKSPSEAAAFLKAAQLYFGDTKSIVERKDSPLTIRINQNQYNELQKNLALCPIERLAYAPVSEAPPPSPIKR